MLGFTLIQIKGYSDVIYLGLDPGIRNFGYYLKGRSGLLGSPINSLKELKLERFKTEITPLLREADFVVVERFLTRGFLTGQVEIVGFMVGVISTIANEVSKPVILIQASQWKNELRRHGIPYGFLTRNSTFLTPHELDAYLLTCYAQDKFASLDWRKVTSLKRIRASNR